MKKFNSYLKIFNNIGKEEIRSANRVLKSGILSGFMGSIEKGYEEKYFGGKYVKKLEKDWAKYYKVKHAISVNSWTSGLTIAIGSLNIEPGDEIIVSPWTMCATATTILHWNAIPIFADIEEDTFCLNPKKVIELINKKTKAILTVDIFGQNSNYEALKSICKKYKLKLIADSAQSPLSLYKKKFVSEYVDIAGFSLNTHKHIQTGEGGILVTNNDFLAKRMKMLRNHGEAIVNNNKNLLQNMLGGNYRMNEIEAAIAIEQLRKLKKIVTKIQKNTNILNSELSKLDGLIIPKVRKNCSHSYYVNALRINEKKINYKRDTIFKELQNEGINFIFKGYSLLHLLPMYQKKIAYGSKGFPWEPYNKKVNYKRGICPISERLDKEIICMEMCYYDFSKKNIEEIIDKFNKVWKKLKIKKLQ